MNKVESVVSFISNYRDIMTFVITIIQLAKIIISGFITGFTETETADRKLYLIRKRIENKVRLSAIPPRNDFYVVSLSTKSIIYKGMLSSLQLRNYDCLLYTSRCG